MRSSLSAPSTGPRTWSSEERRVGRAGRWRRAPEAASRRRHTSSKRDWSSDVCSSDLEVRTYSFLAPGLYDTDSFALHLMDKPASYYYSVLWNKLYRRKILTGHEIFFVSTLHWAEDLVFNLQYIQYASRFFSIDTPCYSYVHNPHGL